MAKSNQSPRKKKASRVTSVETSPTSVELCHPLALISVVSTPEGVEIVIQKRVNNLQIWDQKTVDGAEIKIVYSSPQPR